MKRINFSNYVRQLPSNIILEYLSSKDSSKILTSGVYEKITARFYDKGQILQILSALSDEAKNEIFQIYLSADLGKSLSSQKMKSEILKSFLVFEGIDENSGVFFGFPDLSEIFAGIFEENIVLCNENARPMFFFASFLNDFAIILDMFDSSESKICTDGTYSQRWTDLLRDRCGIGKLLKDYEDLDKILDFVIKFSEYCGAKFLREGGKITLLSNTNELLEKLIQEAGNLPETINKFLKIIDYSFLRTIVKGSEKSVKFNKNSIKGISAELDFSLKFFHWCGLVLLGENSFKIKESKFSHFQNGHVLPDFSIYIPIESNPLHLSKILYSSKITAVDVIYHAKIDKKRLEDSLVSGTDEEEIIGILQIWNAPATIQKTVLEWIHSFKRAFEDLPYIAFRNDLIASIVGHKQLKEKLLPIEGYTFFRVKDGEEKSTLQTLERMGFDLRKIREKTPSLLEEKSEEEEDEIIYKFNRNPQVLAKTQEYIYLE
jgi:hypothetical protein